MLVTYRLGVLGRSIRVQTTAEAGSAPTFFEMKTRPLFPPAHAVDVSAVVRSIAATELPGPPRSPQKSLVSGLGPSRSQSPHGAAPLPVHSLQIACASS